MMTTRRCVLFAYPLFFCLHFVGPSFFFKTLNRATHTKKKKKKKNDAKKKGEKFLSKIKIIAQSSSTRDTMKKKT